jgi:hypothetical protein
MWLSYGYLQQGRHKDARTLVFDCFKTAGGTITMHGGHGAQALDASREGPVTTTGPFAVMRARYLIDTEEWTGELAGWTPPAAAAPSARLTTAYVNGLAALRGNLVMTARDALGELRAARTALEAQLDENAVDQSSRVRAEILELQLSGLIQIAQGDKTTSLDRLREAAALEDKMPFEFGPPFIDKPSHEVLGEALLGLGRAKEARAAFAAALSRTPGRTTALLGLMRAAGAMGDQAKAADVRGQLRTIWRAADSLPADVK